MAWSCTLCAQQNIDDTDPYCEACGAPQGSSAPQAPPHAAPAALPMGAGPDPGAPLAGGNVQVPGFALRVVRGLESGECLALPPLTTLTIGRAPDDDVMLPDPTISRHHVRLHRDALGGLLAEDYGACGAGSANGTLVAGLPAPAGRAAPLSEGSRLQLGKSVELELVRA